MTPFDPGALVSLLERGYPVVSASELARARREHPEAFADGVLFGSKGDKLRLPDGRVFDCIVAAGGPPSGRRWQCALVDPNAPATDDPFALEPGPFEPLEDTPFEPRDPDLFRDLVARELHELGDWDGAYEGARQTAIEAGADTGDEGDDPDLLESAAILEHASEHRADFLPVDELGAISGLSPRIDDRDAEVGPDPGEAAASEVALPDLPGRGREPDDPNAPGHEPPGGHH